MITYRFGRPGELAEITDLINMVFSMLRVPHDFEAMLPKVYGSAHGQPEIHVVAEVDGRIRGCLAMIEFPLSICGQTLRVGYLGSMAVHPMLRGQGVMGRFMEEQIKAAQEKGLDMMILGGQRQRYQRFGFETCGATYTYSISPGNLRHALRETDISALTFKPMTQADVPFARALYNAQPVCGARTEENFLACVQSYREQPFVIEKDGAAQGYLVVTGDGATVTETVTAEDALLLPAIKGFMEAKGMRNLKIEAAPHDARLGRLLSPFAEGRAVSANTMLRVLKPETVLPAYMALKHAVEPLSDGAVVLQLGELGVYEIAVHGGEATVLPTQQDPQAVLSAHEMTRLLFGYDPFGVPQQAKGIVPQGWFPLPYAIPMPDSF